MARMTMPTYFRDYLDEKFCHVNDKMLDLQKDIIEVKKELIEVNEHLKQLNSKVSINKQHIKMISIVLAILALLLFASEEFRNVVKIFFTLSF